MLATGNEENDGGMLSGMEQESLQTLLASIMTTNKTDICEEQRDGLKAPTTPGGCAASTTPASAPVATSTQEANDQPHFVPAMLTAQPNSYANESGSRDGSLETVLKSLQTPRPPHPDVSALLKSSNRAPQSPSTPDLRGDVPSSVENLVNSFLAFNNQSSQHNVSPAQPGPTQGAGPSQQNSTAAGGGSLSNILQQLLSASRGSSQAAPPQQTVGQQQGDGGNAAARDALSALLGGQVAADQGSGRGNDVVTGVGAAAGQRHGGGQLANIVNAVLRERAAASDGGDGTATGFCALGSGTTKITSQQSPPESTQQHSAELSYLPQHSSGSCINHLPSPYKRKIGDSEAAVPHDAKIQKVEGAEDEGEDGDESREQHLNKLRDQLKNLNAANVMLSRYLNGLQSSLTEILAENWSFKILIGCLTSKKASTNPLEQMISSRIASNPSVAIPMLKNIHKSAAANNCNEQLEANSNKNAVFQNMVELLSAQKQATNG